MKAAFFNIAVFGTTLLSVVVLITAVVVGFGLVIA